MVEPGLITAAALDAVRALAAPGVTTLELDAAASAVITGRGARSNFQLVRGYFEELQIGPYERRCNERHHHADGEAQL